MFKAFINKVIVTVVCVIMVDVHANNHISGSVEKRELFSKALAENKLGIDPLRQIRIYLPPEYEIGKTRYPVLYYLPFGRQMLDSGEVKNLLDQSIGAGVIGKFILVTGDFSIPDSMNFFGNNEVVGRWLDHIHSELVTFMDANYRTIPSSESRGICGHFLGGYAAIKLAMMHPEIFGAVYGLHPVATATGERSMLFVPNWQEIHRAQSYEDLKHPYSLPFVAMAQAHLSNPLRPPFFADFIVEQEKEKLTPNQQHINRLFQNFLLIDLVPSYAENLVKLRAIGFDWGRNDPNPAHVYGARKFVVLLEDYGLLPEAVEHSGNSWDYEFKLNGHFHQRLLPFFSRYLVFE